MKTTRPLTPSLRELKGMLRREKSRIAKDRLISRIWAKENPDKRKEYNARYREKHPITPKQRRAYMESWLDRRYSGQSRRYRRSG